MMKKISLILLGLILMVSVALTGCQSGMDPATNTAPSSTMLDPGAAPSEESEPTNNDKKADESEPASGAVIEASAAPSEEYEPQNNDEVPKPSASQNENEIETNQPVQTASDLKITAEGVPVEVRLASDGQYSYEYNKDEYAVTTTTNGSTFEIKVTDIRQGVHSGNQTNVIIYIPNQSYTLITGISTGSSLILPAINANITMTSNASSVMLSLPSGYDKTLNFTGNASSCTLSMSGIDDFAVSANISTSAFSVPSGWPVYDMLSSNYNYTSGSGTAEINIDVTSSSFVFE